MVLKYKHICPCCNDKFFIPKTRLRAFNKIEGVNWLLTKSKDYLCPRCGCELNLSYSINYIYYAWWSLFAIIFIFTFITGWPKNIADYKVAVLFFLVVFAVIVMGLKRYTRIE